MLRISVNKIFYLSKRPPKFFSKQKFYFEFQVDNCFLLLDAVNCDNLRRKVTKLFKYNQFIAKFKSKVACRRGLSCAMARITEKKIVFLKL